MSQAPGKGRAQAQIDVVPENGGIAADGGEVADAGMAVSVALDNLQPSFEGGIVDRPGELAQAAAERRNEAAFPQLSTDGETAPGGGAAEFPPETPDGAGGNFRASQEGRGEAEVLDFAELQAFFGSDIGLEPDVARLGADDRCEDEGTGHADGGEGHRR